MLKIPCNVLGEVLEACNMVQLASYEEIRGTLFSGPHCQTSLDFRNYPVQENHEDPMCHGAPWDNNSPWVAVHL